MIAVVDTTIHDHQWLRGEPEIGSFWRLPGDEPRRWNPPTLRVGGEGEPAAITRAHGTFIAGIIRQLAPEARILSLPVVNDFERAATKDVMDALQWLLDLVTFARDHNRPDLFVDVVNLSFGWYPDERLEVFPELEYRSWLGGLADAGVRVVASAGNTACTIPIYPAAFAAVTLGTSESATQVVSVGALDPDGNPAIYSDSGDWVTLWAPGTGLVSTVPMVSDADWPTPFYRYVNQTYPNPNFAARGFARWDGTSFAAAWVSARIAHHLAAAADLDDLRPDAVQARSENALAAAKVEIAGWRGSRDVPG